MRGYGEHLCHPGLDSSVVRGGSHRLHSAPVVDDRHHLFRGCRAIHDTGFSREIVEDRGPGLLRRGGCPLLLEDCSGSMEEISRVTLISMSQGGGCTYVHVPPNEVTL